MTAGTTAQLPLLIGLQSHAAFANFVDGPNGEVARFLQRASDGRQDGITYIWGNRSTGKSHLLQACCRRVARRGKVPGYLPLRDLPRDDLGILENLEQLDLVCVDDIDAIAGDANWEQAMMDLYNRCHEQHTVMLIAASNVPANTGIGLADLVSRLGWGIVFRLSPLADEDKISALQIRATERGLELPDDVATYLLHRSPRDLVGLFRLLDHLDHASMAAQRKLTIPFVKTVLGM